MGQGKATTQHQHGGSPHRAVNPDSLAAPRGYSHAVVPAAGRTVYLGGQTAQRADGSVVAGGMVVQFEQAAANLVTALDAVGARPEHLVSLQVFVSDAEAYRAALADLGAVWRRQLGTYYPAMALFEVSGLFYAETMVELMGVAVIPEDA